MRQHDLKVLFFELPLSLVANCAFAVVAFALAQPSISFRFGIFIITAGLICVFRFFFYQLYEKKIINFYRYWLTCQTGSHERASLLKKLLRFPLNKSIAEFCLFLLTGILFCIFCFAGMQIGFKSVVLFFCLFVFFSYSYAMFMFFASESSCKKIAAQIAGEDLGSTEEKKFYGNSVKLIYVVCVLIPIIAAPVLSFFYIALSWDQEGKLWRFCAVSLCESFCVVALFISYYDKISHISAHMKNSLFQMKNEKIFKDNLFAVDMENETSYALNLVNNTVLLYDSILKNNTEVSTKINHSSSKLSEISLVTKENVSSQSANLAEAMEALKKYENYSDYAERNFDEVITLASKAVLLLEEIFKETGNNKTKMKSIRLSNKVLIGKLKAISLKTKTVQRLVDDLDNVAYQMKIIAFNSELVANSIEMLQEDLDFTNISSEIKNLTQDASQFMEQLHEQILDLAKESEKLELTGNFTLQKIDESDDILVQLQEKFEKMNTAAGTIFSSSTKVKENISKQKQCFKTVDTNINAVADNIKKFGSSAADISGIIENLKKSSQHILALNELSLSKERK